MLLIQFRIVDFPFRVWPTKTIASFCKFYLIFLSTSSVNLNSYLFLYFISIAAYDYIANFWSIKSINYIDQKYPKVKLYPYWWHSIVMKWYFYIICLNNALRTEFSIDNILAKTKLVLNWEFRRNPQTHIFLEICLVIFSFPCKRKFFLLAII
jgi:hypothetical protein